MKLKALISFLFFFLFIFITPAKAADLNYPNNKFGIHLALPAHEDLEKAAQLVNSSSGDWGYVTLVIHEDDLNQKKWQEVFNKARQLHLIPILRLATSAENNHWRAPQAGDASKWADFLNSLNWVVKNRFVILFNEPNRADEWGGQVNSQNFAEVVLNFSKTLKETNPDFFVMMAGFDSAAPHLPPEYEDQAFFLKKAVSAEPEIFQYLDGWVSHSYPKSQFSSGRNSVLNYQWELNLLKNLGVDKNLPVFITETGWSHQEGETPDYSFPTQETVANLTQNYFLQLVGDNRVVAFTPFILNYPQEPFDHYSWQKNNSGEFYPQYEAVQKMAKIKGEPPQKEKIVIKDQLPAKLIKNSTYQLALLIKNEGQGIWDEKDGYQLNLEGLPKDADYFFSNFNQIQPFEEKTIWLYLKTGEKTGDLPLKVSLAKDGRTLGNQIDWKLEIVQETTIKIIANLLFKRKAQGDNFKFLVYNQNEEVIYSVNRFPLKDGKAELKGLKNLVIGDQYRLVLIKPFYLPRQTFLIIDEKDNQASFKILLPFDFNQDGRFSPEDVWALIKNPKLFKLFLPN
jgi:hypothetical protein